jgi:hypothetical protein
MNNAQIARQTLMITRLLLLFSTYPRRYFKHRLIAEQRIESFDRPPLGLFNNMHIVIGGHADLRMSQDVLDHRAGDGAIALRVLGDGLLCEWFWLDQSDAPTGEMLPIGATTERLADPRMVDFLVGALTEALQRSGWAPGAYTLWLGFGVR